MTPISRISNGIPCSPKRNNTKTDVAGFRNLTRCSLFSISSTLRSRASTTSALVLYKKHRWRLVISSFLILCIIMRQPEINGFNGKIKMILLRESLLLGSRLTSLSLTVRGSIQPRPLSYENALSWPTLTISTYYVENNFILHQDHRAMNNG